MMSYPTKSLNASRFTFNAAQISARRTLSSRLRKSLRIILYTSPPLALTRSVQHRWQFTPSVCGSRFGVRAVVVQKFRVHNAPFPAGNTTSKRKSGAPSGRSPRAYRALTICWASILWKLWQNPNHTTRRRIWRIASLRENIGP